MFTNIIYKNIGYYFLKQLYMSTSNPFTDEFTPYINTYIQVNNKPTATNSSVPSFSRPLSGLEQSFDAGTPFKARPIKHWRKQLTPNNTAGPKRVGLGMPMDIPGGSVYLGANSKDCITCAPPDNSNTFPAGIKENILRTNKIIAPVPSDSFYDCVNETPVCVACNPQNNIIKSATTLLSKNYYTDSRAYLKSRCRLYNQKLSANPVPGITYFNANHTPVQPSNSPTGSQVRLTQDCPQSCQQTPLCQQPSGKVYTIYKPNNYQFAVQGAVSSSTRIDRLKYNTITNNGNSFYSAWGWEGANAGKYQGTSTAPYFLKSKYQKPTVYHARQNKEICCQEDNLNKPLVVSDLS